MRSLSPSLDSKPGIYFFLVLAFEPFTWREIGILEAKRLETEMTFELERTSHHFQRFVESREREMRDEHAAYRKKRTHTQLQKET